MPDLPEIDEFTAGVYQIEAVDDVIGGVNGISNSQAKALANRTKHLKEHALVDDTNPVGNYTIGDLFYALGARLLGKLGVGAANRVLCSTGSAPVWRDWLEVAGITVSGYLRSATATLAVPNNTWTTIHTPATDGLYLFHVRTQAYETNYVATASVGCNILSTILYSTFSGTVNLELQVNAGAVQVRHQYGIPITVLYSYLIIS